MKRINEIRNELRIIAEKEATKIYRLARKAKQHGCTERLVMMIQEEGHQLNRMNPEDIMNPFIFWQYAFKF